tara:strand:+ start:338 stop:1861 length:1524 start_codon:yes stop_codon:yes gene_type:complete
MNIINKLRNKVSSDNKHIIKFGLVTLIVTAIALVLNSTIIRNFGISANLDLYVISFILITFILKPINDGSIAIFLLPKYINSKIKQKFLNYNIIIFVLSGVLISIIFYYLADNIIKLLFSGLSDLQVADVSQFFRICLIVLPIEFFIGVVSVYFFSKYDFNFAGKLEIINKIISILLIILFSEDIGVKILIYAFVLNRVINFLIIIIIVNFDKIRNELSVKKNFEKKSNFKRNELIKSLFEMFGLIIFHTALFSQLNLIGTGIVSLYYFSRQIINGLESFLTRPITIISHTLSTEKNYNEHEASKILYSFLFKNLFIILLVLVYVFFAGEYFISFLWNKTNIIQNISIIYILFLMIIDLILLSNANIFYRFNLAFNRSKFHIVIFKFFLSILFAFLIYNSDKFLIINEKIFNLLLIVITFNFIWLLYNLFFYKFIFEILKKVNNQNILFKSFLFFSIQIMVLTPIFNFEFFEFDLLNLIFSILIILLLQVILIFSNYFKILLKIILK